MGWFEKLFLKDVFNRNVDGDPGSISSISGRAADAAPQRVPILEHRLCSDPVVAEVSADPNAQCADEFRKRPLDILTSNLLFLKGYDKDKFNEAVKSIDLLVDSGADVKTPHLNGVTPLHCASIACAPTVVKMLIEKGADPESTARFSDELDLTSLGACLLSWGTQLRAASWGYDENVHTILRGFMLTKVGKDAHLITCVRKAFKNFPEERFENG